MSRASKATRFSKARQPPKGKVGRKRKVRLEGKGKWNEAEVYKLAEQGVEPADIAVILQLTGLLQADAAVGRMFEEVVAKGHAHHRARAAMLVRSEAEKGRSNPLMGLAKAWLDRYADEQLTPEEEVGIVERLGELVGERKEHRKSVAAATV